MTSSISLIDGPGFVARALASALARVGPSEVSKSIPGAQLRVYCRGTTRQSPDQVERVVASHIGEALEARAAAPGRFVYLSTLGVYRLRQGPVSETTPVSLDPAHPLDLYGLCKATAEAALIAVDPTVVVLRLARIYDDVPGGGHFLDDIVTSAITAGHITFSSPAGSAKDFLHVDDLARTLLAVAAAPTFRGIVNVGSGRNTTNEEFATTLAALTGCTTSMPDYGANEVVYPEMDVTRLRQELAVSPRPVLAALPALVARYRRELARA